MIDFLIRKFIKGYDNPEEKCVREQYGQLGSIVGLILNILIFSSKIVGGLLTHSISVIGDALNNLTDTVSSIILIIGFKISNKPADKEHPFGHARSEYLFSTVVAAIILLVGVQLVIESAKKVIHPEAIVFRWVTVFILVGSIVIKFWMSIFYREIGRRIKSLLLEATAVDSLADCISTSAVLIALLLFHFMGWNFDGVIGCVVGVIIIKAGVDLIRDTVDKILGAPASKTLRKDIENFVRNYDDISNTHDLIVHDYGPGYIFASIHAEVDAKEDPIAIHDTIDRIEREINEQLNIELTIHTDPIILDDPKINALYDRVFRMVKEIDNDWDLHDFRVIKSDEHVTIVFDLEVEIDEEKNYDEIREIIAKELIKIDSRFIPNITIDRGILREVQ